MQVVLYRTQYPDDDRYKRGVVMVVWYVECLHASASNPFMRVHISTHRLLETLHTALCLHLIYFYTTTGFGNAQAATDYIVW